MSGRWVAGALGGMMFLEYGARGVWYPYLTNYLTAPATGGGLSFTGAQAGWIMGLASAIGAVASPVVAGQLADRYLNAEKALGALMVVSAVALIAMAGVRDYPTFLLLALVQSLAYMPTLALSNGVAFAHLEDVEHSFPAVRMWGTVAWMISSSAFPLIWLRTGSAAGDTARIADSLTVGAVMCAALAVVCFTMLPKTPPHKATGVRGRALTPALSRSTGRGGENGSTGRGGGGADTGVRPYALVEAFGLLRRKELLALVAVALPVSIIHTAYYIRVGPFYQQVFDDAGIRMKWVGPAMALGQFTEIVALLLLGRLLKRLGYRAIFAIALGAFVVRFAMFAVGRPVWLVIAGGALHGVCFAFFFAAAYVYVETVAPAEARYRAQTMFNLIILGVGPVLAGFYNGWFDRFMVGGRQEYGQFWWTGAAVAALCLVGTVVIRE